MYTPWLEHLRVHKQSRQFTNHMEVYGDTFLSRDITSLQSCRWPGDYINCS